MNHKHWIPTLNYTLVFPRAQHLHSLIDLIFISDIFGRSFNFNIVKSQILSN